MVIAGFEVHKGLGEYFPCQPIFSGSRVWELEKIGACGRPQAVLAIRGKLPVGSLRVLGCIGSLLKTHTGVSACFRRTVRMSGFRALHGK